MGEIEEAAKKIKQTAHYSYGNFTYIKLRESTRDRLNGYKKLYKGTYETAIIELMKKFPLDDCKYEPPPENKEKPKPKTKEMLDAAI